MLECRGISQTYGSLPILTDVSLTMRPGEVHQISGPSGGGKTTLLRILCLLEAPASGGVFLDGKQFLYRDIFRLPAWTINAEYRRAVTLVSQQIFLWPHLSCRENIEIVGGDANKYERLAELMDVTKCLERYPNQVSVGQRQRVAIIRALATEPKYLVLDEVTSALDEKMSDVVTAFFGELAEGGMGIIIITHRNHKWRRGPTAWWLEHGRLSCRT